MKAWLVDPLHTLKASDEQSYYYPSSPVTVLSMERIDHHINDCRVDLSFFRIPGSNANPESSAAKRKREEE